MSNLPETSSFDSVYELQRTDSVDAGVAGAGVSNTQAQNLTNRTKYLFDQFTALNAGTLTGTTQPLFDASLKYATTAFVEVNKGMYVNVARINSSINPLAVFGTSWTEIANSLFVSDSLVNSSQIIVLLSLAAIPAGTAVHFSNESNFSYTLQTATGELFLSPTNLDSGNTGQNTIVVQPGTIFTIVRSATDSVLGTSTPYWHVIVHEGNLRQWINISSFGTDVSALGVTPQYKREGNYLVLRGGLQYSGSVTSFVTLFTLPTGYVPNLVSTVNTIWGAGAYGIMYVTVNNAGGSSLVTAVRSDSTTFTSQRIGLDGVRVPLN